MLQYKDHVAELVSKDIISLQMLVKMLKMKYRADILLKMTSLLPPTAIFLLPPTISPCVPPYKFPFLSEAMRSTKFFPIGFIHYL